MKILKKLLQKGSEKTTPKQMRKKHGKNRKWTPKWRPRGGHFLVIWLLFSVPGGLGSQNGFQGLAQQPLGSAQGSISIDFGTILNDFLMIFCIMWALPSTVSRHGGGKAEGHWISCFLLSFWGLGPLFVVAGYHLLQLILQPELSELSELSD